MAGDFGFQMFVQNIYGIPVLFVDWMRKYLVGSPRKEERTDEWVFLKH